METVVSNQSLLEMYRVMLLARRLDKKIWLLNRAGKVPFVVSGQGHEAAQVAVAFALNKEKDFLAPYYRDLATVLAWGMTAKEIMLSYLAKKDDPNSGGRQMPNHFGCKRLRIFTGSSPLTTQATHTVGAAYAAKMQGKSDVVFMTSFGEGSTNQGDFHDALNFASIYKLPVLFVCQNNEYAISTHVNLEVAVEKVSDRAKGYNIPGVTVDGTDVISSYTAAKQAIDLARGGGGPTLLECKVKRLTAHSSDDNASGYMTKEEISNLKLYDPVKKTLDLLLSEGIASPSQLEEISNKVSLEVDEALDFAEKAPDCKAEDALLYVYE